MTPAPLPSAPVPDDRREARQAAIRGAIGGGLLGPFSLGMPALVRPQFRLPLLLIAFIVLALSALGAIVAVMNLRAQDRRRPRRVGDPSRKGPS